MKILFLGDSITSGVGASEPTKNYVELVGKALDCCVGNYGGSGTRIADQKEGNSEYFLRRAKRMPKDADFVFVFGGTNDYGHGLAEIGTFSDETDFTFYGALKNLVKYLVETYGRERLCFILPLHRFNERNLFGDGTKKQAVATLQEYVEILKEVLLYFNIDFFDFDKEIPEPLDMTNNGFFKDGLHPNDRGHQAIANKIVEYYKEKEKVWK